MKFIQKLCFPHNAEAALALYERVFGCRVRTLLRYADAVKNGWEQPDPEKDGLVYHSEIMFGEQEVRMEDLSDDQEIRLTQETEHILGFDTEEEVTRAFNVLSEGGEIIRPLEKPPFMIVIGTVRDRFGLKWTLMCDY